MQLKLPASTLFSILLLALPAPAAAQVRTDAAQWDFEGSLDSTTGQPPLVESGVGGITFETVDIGGASAEAARVPRGAYLQVLHGFPSNGGAYVNQYTLILDVMFPDRSPSGGWASLLQSNCCNQNDGDWFVDPSGGLGISGNYGGSIGDGDWHRVALTVDLVAGSYTSYLDGVQVQQNGPTSADMGIDGRFSLYSPTDPDAEDHFYIFADESGDDAEVVVSSFQFRDSALPASEIEELGGASAEGIPLPALTAVRRLPGTIVPGSTFPVEIDIVAYEPFASATIRERIPLFWTASDPSPPGRIEVDANGRQTLVWEITGGVVDQTLAYLLTAPSPFAAVSFPGSGVEADGKRFKITGDLRVPGGSDGFAVEALVITMRQPTASCAGNDPGLAAQALDYLADDDVLRETTAAPAAGDSIAPDFLGASPSPGSVGSGSLAWTRTLGPLFRLSGCDDCLSYVAFYAENTTGETLRVSVASASDDGQQILIDGREVWNNSIPRGNGRVQVQDRSPLLDISPGKHLVMQKVFEGCGDFDSAIRFEDGDGNPLVGPVAGGPLAFSLDPTGYSVAASFALRDVPGSLDAGETGTVTLKLRARDEVEGATVEENVPAAFAISDVSDGGVAAGGRIVWTLTSPLSSRDLSYRITVPEGSKDEAFTGTATLGGRTVPIVGDTGFTRGAMSSSGFIKQWLVLGPLDTLGVWPGDPTSPPVVLDAPSAAPENGDLLGDFLTDGTTTERTVRPFDGMRLSPAFAGSVGDGISTSKALGLEPTSRPCAPEVPTWEAYQSPTGTFDHDAYFGGPVDSHATYAACYLTNTTGAPLEATVAIHSDDAFIAFLDGVEIVSHEPPPCSAAACGRPYGAEDTVADTAAVTILPGEHLLLTRVHDGTGRSGHRLRFQDAQGSPILNDRLKVSLRSTLAPPAARVRRLLSSDEYRLGDDLPEVTLRVESTGTHAVTVKETLPAGWSALDVSHGGTAALGQVTWSLPAVTGILDLTYRLTAGDCAGGGSWCGNGPDGSEYTVDGGTPHALMGDDSLRRRMRGTDDLGPWEARDVASSGGATHRRGDHDLDVKSLAAGIRGSQDQFRFISLPATGDFSLTARIDCLDDPGLSGLAGLMVRDTFDAFSAHVLLALSSTPPDGGGAGTLRATFRRDTNRNRISSPIALSPADQEVLALPVWLGLERTGNVISLRRSDDGSSFRQIATREVVAAAPGANQVLLGSDFRIGLAVTSGGAGATRADFREVSGPAFTTPPLEPPLLAPAVGGPGKVDLSWSPPASGAAPTAYAVFRSTVPGGGPPFDLLAEVPGAQASYTDAGLAPGVERCYVVRSRSGLVESVDSNGRCATPLAEGGLFRRGDTDANGGIDLSDAIGVLQHLFLGAARPACWDAADTDDNGSVDISDAIANLQYQFLGGAAPAAPGPTSCGADPSAEEPDLGCERSC